MPERKNMGSSERETSDQDIVFALATSVAPFNKASFDNAFALLERKYRERLLRKLCAMLCYRELAEEILQEALFSASLSLQKFQPERMRQLKPQAWLYKIAINRAKKHLEKKKLLEMSIQSERFDVELLDRLEVPMQERPETISEALDIHEQVLGAILKLPAIYQKTAFLYFVEDYSSLEIARLLNQLEGTVKSHISRSRKLLQASLKMLVDEEG
jgi:RNA polymerase sigma-70 factor, ECF subfamily